MAAVPRPTADQAAFEELYRLHARSVYGFVHSRIGNADDAEDVTQTTFLNAYRSYLRGRYPEHPESWLIAIARNECRQRYRQLKRRPATERLEDRTIFVPGPESDWTASDIQRALNALPELSRRALVLRELEGRSYAEIARELELSDSALQALLFRSRRQLREQFEQTLSCAEARRSLTLRAKGQLGIAGRRALRVHLRSCTACAERERRPTRKELAMQLLLVTLPVRRVLRVLGLAGGGSGSTAGAGAGGAVAAKTAVVLAASAISGGIGYTIAEEHHASPAHGQHRAGHVTRARTGVAPARSAVVRWAPKRVSWLTAATGASHSRRQPRDGEPEGTSTSQPTPAGPSSGTTTPTDPLQTPQPEPSTPPSVPTGDPASPTSAPLADPAAETASAPTAEPQAGQTPPASDGQTTSPPNGRAKGRPNPPGTPQGPPPERNPNGAGQPDGTPSPAAPSGS